MMPYVRYTWYTWYTFSIPPTLLLLFDKDSLGEVSEVSEVYHFPESPNPSYFPRILVVLPHAREAAVGAR
jgi:hypothetical protein